MGGSGGAISCRHTGRCVAALRVARIVLLNIFRDIDQHGAGSIPSRQREGLPHDRRDVGHAGQRENSSW